MWGIARRASGRCCGVSDAEPVGLPGPGSPNFIGHRAARTRRTGHSRSLSRAGPLPCGAAHPPDSPPASGGVTRRVPGDGDVTSQPSARNAAFTDSRSHELERMSKVPWAPCTASAARANTRGPFSFRTSSSPAIPPHCISRSGRRRLDAPIPSGRSVPGAVVATERPFSARGASPPQGTL